MNSWKFTTCPAKKICCAIPRPAAASRCPINSQHPELVLQIIDYLRNDKEMNYLVQRGIYGEDAQWYFAGELNEDGTTNENVTAAGARSQLYGGNWICWSAFRNWDYQIIESEQNSIPGYREIFFDMDSRSINNIMQSFTFDSSNCQNELAAMQKRLRTVREAAALGLCRPGYRRGGIHCSDGSGWAENGH